MGWNLEDYETVDSRIHKFWEAYPMGRIETELLAHDGSRFVFVARLYRTDADPTPFATGHAEEIATDRGVNATSACENCETSAIGRALASGGLSAKGKRASREEMSKVQRYGDPGHKVEHPNKPVVEPKPVANEPDPVTWEDFEPKAFQDDGSFLETITQSLGATVEGFSCKHGQMIRKEGTSKQGKPYYGFVCGAKSKNDQCEAKWAKNAGGRWVFEGKATD